MSSKITSNEIYVMEGGARVRTRCPKQDITDARITWVAKTAKLDVGNIIRVQCMSHFYDTVFWQRLYLVARRRDFLRQTENERGDVNYQDAFEVVVVPESEWREIMPEPMEEKASGSESKKAAAA